MKKKIKKKSPRLKKPKQVVSAPYWDYHQVIKYLEKKYKIRVRDYAGKWLIEWPNDHPYLDFWHWMIDNYDWIHNGCYIFLTVKNHLEDPATPVWVKEILQRIHDEFQEDDMRCWIEW